MPFPVGGSTDYLARLLVADLNVQYGGRFYVENRVGAGGTIGTRVVALARADGRTLLYTTATPFSINPHIQKTLPYDPVNGFSAIALTVLLPLVLVTGTQPGGVSTLQGLIATLRDNGQATSYGSYGNGTASHIAGALFCRYVGASDVVHVPYKDAKALADLAEGRTTFHIDAWSNVASMVDAGKLSVLAACSSEAAPWSPAAPTVASVIGRDFDMTTWHGLFAPRDTPDEILQQLNRDVGQWLATSAIQKAALAAGCRTGPHLSCRDVESFVASDRARWKRLIETAGIERL